jgi:hypothetical protein
MIKMAWRGRSVHEELRVSKQGPGAVTTCALNRSALTYGRRDAFASLLAVPIVLAAGMSSAAETVKYPLWGIETGGGRVYLLGHTPPTDRLERLADRKIATYL